MPFRGKTVCSVVNILLLSSPTLPAAFTHSLQLHHPHLLPPSPSPAHSDSDSLSSPTRHSLSLSDGSEDQLDRLQQVELARSSPMSLWRAGTVQAWLEVVMAMPMYIRSCSENVKSGKVMKFFADWLHSPKVIFYCGVLNSPGFYLAGFTWAHR